MSKDPNVSRLSGNMVPIIIGLLLLLGVGIFVVQAIFLNRERFFNPDPEPTPTPTIGFPVITGEIEPILQIVRHQPSTDRPVPINTEFIFQFDKALDPRYISNEKISFTQDETNIAFEYAYDVPFFSLVIKPVEHLEPETTYQITLDASISSVDGAALPQRYVLTFLTESVSLSQNLEGYFPLDKDMLNNVRGTVESEPVGGEFVPGRSDQSGQAYQLQKTDEFIEFRDLFDLNTGPWTITCWLKLNRLPIEYHSMADPIDAILAQLAGDFPENDIYLALVASGDSANHLQSVPQNLNPLDSGMELGIDEWYHVGLQYDGRIGKLFINGTKRDEKTIQFTTYDPDQSLFLTIDGLVDDIRFYRRALNDSEMVTLWNSP